tara:strand:+ start:13783 stop:14463 length:681 start_codon:yes stop_codon:yes gene_type:complete
MALTIPNTFSTNTKIEAVKMHENLEAVKDYVNGGMAVGDIQTAAPFAQSKHFMKGLYFPTDNHNEMLSGLYQGPSMSDLPTFHPGYAGIFVADIAGSAPPQAVPGAGISFYLEEEADVMFTASVSPRGLPLLAGTDGAALTAFLDTYSSANNNYSQMLLGKEDDPSVSSGAGADIPGFYRRRFYQVHTVFPTVSAGYHTIYLGCRSDLRAVSLKFYSYSVQCYYRT